jgi:hypothetical protein
MIDNGVRGNSWAGWAIAPAQAFFCVGGVDTAVIAMSTHKRAFSIVQDLGQEFRGFE